MAVDFAKTFLNGEAIPDTGTILYTVADPNVKVSITAARVTNYSAGTESFTIQILQNNQVAGDLFKAIISKDIAAGETINLSEIIGEAINKGGGIHAVASTVSTLSLTVTGTEFTT